MSLEQAIVTILVALIAAMGGISIERRREKRDQEKERSVGAATIEQARIAREKAIDEASRDIRDFLDRKVHELHDELTDIETRTAAEREKWNQMLGELSTKNLQLELQHKRDVARMEEMEEEAKFLDEQVQVLRTRILTLENDGATIRAHLELQTRERERLQKLLEQGH